MNPFDYPKRHKREYCEVKNSVLFLDVVGFSKGTTNEEMKEMIRKINQVIEDELEQTYYWNEEEHSNNLILISTGDGFAVGFHPDLEAEEILNVAAKLFRKLNKKGAFTIRMGLAEGPNVRYIDKNEVVNLFGYGINLAKRVCDAAEEGQILVAEDFAKDLLNKKHISGLVSLSEPREIKHGQKVVVYNYHEKGKFGRKASELSE